MNNWLSSITNWFFSLFQKSFAALVDFIHDFAIWISFQITDTLANAIVTIPVPAFLSNGLDISALMTGFPGLCLYILGKMHLSVAFGILTAGIAFRLLRKLFTLGQW